MKHKVKSFSSVAKVVLLLFVFLLVSCAPQSKEVYLEKYKEFISEVSQNHETYTEEEWEKSFEDYMKFSGEWYSLFQDDLTWKEQLLVGKYEIQYNLMKVKEGSVGFFSNFLKDDYEKLKNQVEYYYENDMSEDIDFLIDQAREIGDSAVSMMTEIIEDLEIELDELFD